MNLKLDKSGRLVVPKSLRDRLGFTPNTEIELIEQPSGVLLRLAQQRPSMVKIDGLWVHQGVAQEGAEWDRLIDAVRDERSRSFQAL